jgi:outer membrane protein assembly factor BamA
MSFGSAGCSSAVFAFAVCSLAILSPSVSSQPDSKGPDTRPDVRREVLRAETPVTYQSGDFFAVPIPLTNPTLGGGLVVGGGYFHPQTAAQAAKQPASLTGAAALATDNGTRVAGVFHQGYWLDDRWRFTAAAGLADVRLSLITPEAQEELGDSLDWQLKGAFLFAGLSRRVAQDWYAGLSVRSISVDQTIGLGSELDDGEFNLSNAPSSSGVGLSVEFDSRDLPTNPSRGRRLKGEFLHNPTALGSQHTYSSANVALNTYHPLGDGGLVVASDVKACQQWGRVPLWDACRLPLRGFAAFDYLGARSVAGQLEGRWPLRDRFGLVAFAGAGVVKNSFGRSGASQTVSSYGVGLRFDVLPAKRVNLRLDFAWSDDDQAIYLSVGEAF